MAVDTAQFFSRFWQRRHFQLRIHGQVAVVGAACSAMARSMPQDMLVNCLGRYLGSVAVPMRGRRYRAVFQPFLAETPFSAKN